MAVAAAGAQLEALASKIREMVANRAEVIYAAHARGEMAKDQVVATDAQAVLKGCAVVRYEAHGTGEWRATCRGRTRQGELVEMSVRILEEDNKIQVVTVYRI
jgi:hypothetical protein